MTEKMIAARMLIALAALFALAACSTTPDPTAAPTPDPTAASTSDPAAAPTSAPAAASTPDPTTASTSAPAATSTPDPTTASTPDPTTAPAPTPTATPAPAWRSSAETTSTTDSRVAFIGDQDNPPALIITCAEFDDGSILAVSYAPTTSHAAGEFVSVTLEVGGESLTLRGEESLGVLLLPFDRSDDVIDLLLRGSDRVSVNDDEFALAGYTAAVADIRPCEAK